MTGTIRGKETREGNQVKMEAGTGAQQLRDQECQGLLATHQEQGGLPYTCQREYGTFILNFWPSELRPHISVVSHLFVVICCTNPKTLIIQPQDS